MRVDRLYMVSGNRKERRAQIAAMGRKERAFRERVFRYSARKAAQAESDKETL